MKIEAGKTLTFHGINFNIKALSVDAKTGDISITYECLGVVQEGDFNQFRRFVAGSLRDLGKI